jgi:hypothetical protein
VGNENKGVMENRVGSGGGCGGGTGHGERALLGTCVRTLPTLFSFFRVMRVEASASGHAANAGRPGASNTGTDSKTTTVPDALAAYES